MKISIVGLGKLGSPIAAVMAHKGHTVVGVDISSTVVDLINNGVAPVQEPGLQALMEQNRERLSATSDFDVAIGTTDVTFIIVPTPSEPGGDFSLRYVRSAASSIGNALRSKSRFHLVVLSSTVMPGSTSDCVLPILETTSGKRCGRDFGLCYNPEFIALGSVIHDILNPDMVLIGEFDKHSGTILAGLHTSLVQNTPVIARMNFVNAELTKLSVNTYVTTKISFANMIAQICEALPGADVDVVTSALGVDSRIGRKYLKGGVGYGGPCFPRDNWALVALSRHHGIDANLAEATDQINHRQVPRLAEIILERLPQAGTVGILGLSYKPGTDVIEESQGLMLARHLLSRGIKVVAYDPAAMALARPHLPGVMFAQSVGDCVRQSHVVAIVTPWEEFASLSPSHLNPSLGQPTILDCWRVLPRQKFAHRCNYVALGTGPQQTPKHIATLEAVAKDSTNTGRHSVGNSYSRQIVTTR